MRRKVKAGLIEADHDECAIVVHYEVEATVLGELGEPIVAERQENTKRIKLKTLSENTNLPRLAEEILEKCKLIHVRSHAWQHEKRTVLLLPAHANFRLLLLCLFSSPAALPRSLQASKLSQVEQLLRELVDERGKRERSSGAGAARKSGRSKESRQKSAGSKGMPTEETPSLDNLERYMEMMYDDPETATQATHMILQLSRSPENLEALLESEALLGLLARLLQEEGPKSMDLAINILYILYSFSNFSQFHPALYQARLR